MDIAAGVSGGQARGMENEEVDNDINQTEIRHHASYAEPASTPTQTPSFKYKLIQQLGITNAYIAQGAFAEIIGPTLQDLLDMFDVTYEVIAEGLAVRAAGFGVGAIIGCILNDILHRRPALLVGIGLLFSALGVVLIPYSPSALMFTIVIFLPGMGRGIMTVDVTYEVIAEGLAVRAAGFGVGAIIGCILNDILHRRPALLVGIGLLFSALGVVLIPYSPSALMFTIVIFLPGMGRGIMTVGGVVQTMDIWQEKAAAPMQSLYFAYDLGAILMTETVRPFLSSSIEGTESNNSMNMIGDFVNNTTTAVNGSFLGTTTDTPSLPSSSSRLVYPFMIVGVYTAVAGLIMFALHCYDLKRLVPTQKKTPCKQELTCPPCSAAFIRACVITLGASLYCFHSNGGEQNYMTYLPSYAVDSEVHFTKNQATTLTTTVRFAMFFGRFCGIVAAYFLKIQYLIVVSVASLIVTFSCWLLLPQISTIILWVLAIIAGMFISVQYAAGMTLANLYVKTSSLVTMIWFMGSSLGLLSYEYTTGYSFDEYGVYTLSYIMLVYAVSLMSVFILIQTVAKFHENRFRKDKIDGSES